MEGSLEDIKKKVARFEKELTTLEREREDSIYLLYRDIDGLGHQAEERLREFRKHLLPIIISQYRNYAHGVHGTPREIGRDLKEKAHELIEIALAEHRVLLLIGGWLAATVSGFAGFGGGSPAASDSHLYNRCQSRCADPYSGSVDGKSLKGRIWLPGDSLETCFALQHWSHPGKRRRCPAVC